MYADFLDVGDMFVYGGRGDQIFLAEFSFDQAALQMAFGAITLDAARRAGKAALKLGLASLSGK
jgi:hypothetical protein